MPFQYFDLYTSEWIIGELDKKSAGKFGHSPARRLRITDIIRERHTILVPTDEMPTDCCDADDNSVLQISLFVNANLLLTGDQDLLALNRVDPTVIINPKAIFELYIR